MCGFKSLSRQDNQKNDFKMVQLGLQCLLALLISFFLTMQDQIAIPVTMCFSTSFWRFSILKKSVRMMQLWQELLKRHACQKNVTKRRIQGMVSDHSHLLHEQ